MWSDKAVEAALDHLPMYANFPDRVRRALDAAAAVDGNVQRNAVLEESAEVAERDKDNPTAGKFIAAAIRSLKRP